MSRIEELQKRVEHLETEVELLKEIVKLQSNANIEIALRQKNMLLRN